MMTEDKDFSYMIDHFFPRKVPVEVYQGKSGYNNTTRYLKRNDQQYILRIYETHNEEQKVQLEHEVLLTLNELRELPFKIPVPVIKDGQSLVRLPSNKIGCIYHYIEGSNPVFDNEKPLFSFGQRTGQLLLALQKIKVNQPFVYRPYYEIEHAHPKCPIDKVVEWCKNPDEPFKECSNELKQISAMLIAVQGFLPFIKKLPHQIIHGDLNASNVLIDENQKINAILDFEFATSDVRMMEVAVCISDMMTNETNETLFLEKVHHFFSGFAPTVTLLDEEFEALPVLIQLRRLDVFIHFLGRYLDEIDDPSVLKEQLLKTAAFSNWLSEGGDKVVSIMKRAKSGI